MALPDIDLMEKSPEYREFIKSCVNAWLNKNRPKRVVEYVTVTDALTRQKRVVARVIMQKPSPPRFEQFFQIEPLICRLP